MVATKVLHKKKVLAPILRFKGFNDSWEFKNMGELGSFMGGGTPTTSVEKYWIGNIPWISSSDLFDDDLHNINIHRYLNKEAISESATKIIPEKSVLLISRVGVGKLAINRMELCTSQDFSNFIPSECDCYFIGYFLLARRNLLINFSQGTSIKGFTTSDIKSLKISIPTLPEQQKIASFLSAVDEKIQQLTRKKELLREYKKGVMQQLFSGKLRFKGHTDKWKKIVFTECCDLIHGFQFREEHFENSGLPVIKIGSLIDNGSISFHNATYVSQDCEHIYSKFILKKGDVLMALTGGTLGKVSRIDKDYGVIFQNYRVGKFENKSNSLKEYIYFLLQSRLVQNRLKSLVNEAAQPNFGKQDFDKIRFALPSLTEQKKIADYLSNIDTKIESVNKQITQTQTFKKGLLQQMFV